MKKSVQDRINRHWQKHVLRQTANELSSQLRKATGISIPVSVSLRDGNLFAQSYLPIDLMDAFLRADMPENRGGKDFTFFPGQNAASILRHTFFILGQKKGANQPFPSRYTVESAPGKEANIIQEEILVGLGCCADRCFIPESLSPKNIIDVPTLEVHGVEIARLRFLKGMHAGV